MDGILHHSTAHHSTAQCSTAQHSAAQHSTVQHSTALHTSNQHVSKQQHQHVQVHRETPDSPLKAPILAMLKEVGFKSIVCVAYNEKVVPGVSLVYATRK